MAIGTDITFDTAGPYQPPDADLTHAAQTPLQRRGEHLLHESFIRGFGLYCQFWGVFIFALLGLVFFLGMSGLATGSHGASGASALGFFFLLITAVLAYGLWAFGGHVRDLNPKTRIPLVFVVFVLSFLSLPFGLLTLATLYFVLSQKGAMVYSPEYRDVRFETQHIRDHSILVCLGLIAVPFLLAGAAFLAVLL